jgi:hypothetical protein
MECLEKGLDAGFEPGLSLFSADFTPEEMDSVTRIFHQSNSLSNTLKECEDCIAVLMDKSTPKIADATSMSDEAYLSLFKKK